LQADGWMICIRCLFAVFLISFSHSSKSLLRDKKDN
jgi:hypothetical protein